MTERIVKMAKRTNFITGILSKHICFESLKIMYFSFCNINMRQIKNWYIHEDYKKKISKSSSCVGWEDPGLGKHKEFPAMSVQQVRSLLPESGTKSGFSVLLTTSQKRYSADLHYKGILDR
jgi:hypothetical protein